MAARREQLLSDIPMLDINDQVISVAEDILLADIVPDKAADDAFHIACAAVHQIDFLLTWNCKHIANPHNRKRIRSRFARHGLEISVICAPEEFLRDHDRDITTKS